MVTIPSEAAEDPVLVRALLAHGMDCARINCAHDDAEVWGRMVAHLRSAERDLGKPCKIFMDLAGPKLRTGQVEPGRTGLEVEASPRRVRTGHGASPCLALPARLSRAGAGWGGRLPAGSPKLADTARGRRSH